MHKNVEQFKKNICLPIEFHSRPETYFNYDKVYFIVGNLNQFCFEILNWMFKRNCSKIIFLRTSDTGYDRYLKSRIRSLGFEFYELNLNVFSENHDKVLNFSKCVGFIGGFFNFVNFEEKSENIPLKKLINIGQVTSDFLDVLSRNYMREIENFVTLIFQDNSIYDENSYKNLIEHSEKICIKRIKDGLKVLAIEYEIIKNIEKTFIYKMRSSCNFCEQKLLSLMEILGPLLQTNGMVTL